MLFSEIIRKVSLDVVERHIEEYVRKIKYDDNLKRGFIDRAEYEIGLMVKGLYLPAKGKLDIDDGCFVINTNGNRELLFNYNFIRDFRVKMDIFPSDYSLEDILIMMLLQNIELIGQIDFRGMVDDQVIDYPDHMSVKVKFKKDSPFGEDEEVYDLNKDGNFYVKGYWVY